LCLAAHYGQFHFYFSLTDSQAYISPLGVVSGMYMGGAEHTFYISRQVEMDSTILTPPISFSSGRLLSFEVDFILSYSAFGLARFRIETEMGNTHL